MELHSYTHRHTVFLTVEQKQKNQYTTIRQKDLRNVGSVNQTLVLMFYE